MTEELATLVTTRMGELTGFMSEVREKFAGYDSSILTLKQRGFRFTGDSGSAQRSDSLGSLVTKSAEVTSFLNGRIRGSARVAIPGRLITRAAPIITGTTLAPGVQSLPIAELPGARPVVSDLIPQRTLTEGALQFPRQLAPHPVAGIQVAQGDVKAESTIAFEMVSLVPEVLAVWVTASRQALRDVAGLQLLIDNELVYAIKLLQDHEVLNGAGAPGHLTGIVPTATVVAPVVGDSALDAIARVLGALIASGSMPTGIVLNTGDWLNISLLKNANEDYVLGSPAREVSQVLWGVSLVLSPALAPGTVLAGDFIRGAELAFREDATVEISTEHSDYFVKNLCAIRAEESLALAVKTPSAFAKTTLPVATP